MREAFFLDVPGGGQRFCIHYPVKKPRAVVLYIHPFAEEMNKSRRMAALQARAFASMDVAVLQMDLAGCGDSSGDFGDATWQAWLDDVGYGRAWLAERYASTPLYLWGLRAGSLLASSSVAAHGAVAGQLWWQPPASGRVLVQQWLRLRLGAELLGKGDKVTTESLRQQLRDGLSVEVAGYACAPDLLLGMELAELAPPKAERIGWFELSRAETPQLLPVSLRTVESWVAQGGAVEPVVLGGTAFWQSTEIEVCELLVERTCAWMLQP